MDPVEKYNLATLSEDYQQDAAQKIAVDVFQQIFEQLCAQSSHVNPINKLLKKLSGFKTRPVPGLYLWGDVGRGKTWLMNLFFESLPFKEKKRLHFHHFMLSVHEQLSNSHQQKNPLQSLAKKLASQYRVICLDEFIVTNITDAMLLYGLLDQLFDYGVTLIATSNRIPDDLYLNGLQRERFFPAIALIKQHTHVVHLDSHTDHRLALLEKSMIYLSPINHVTNEKLEHHMTSLATSFIEKNKLLRVLNRDIQTIACADEIAWFEFNALCDAPRAAQDYICLAEDFHTIILSDIPVLNEYQDDKARRFIYLIDELYDKSVKIIISAEAQPDNLYTGDMLKFAFKRTSSRLIEMRSEEYLKKAHVSES